MTSYPDTDAAPALRLQERGPAALTDIETAALALGWKSASAQKALKAALDHFGSLRNLTTANQAALARVRGVGETKAAQLAALFELQCRIAREPGRDQPINSDKAVYDLLASEMGTLTQESIRVVLLNQRYHLIRVEEVSRGTVNQCFAEPRDILKLALYYAAPCLILVHNHPSGDPTPSKGDHNVTHRVNVACQAVGIEFTDHIIIGRPSEAWAKPFFSFREAGIL